MDVDVRFVDVDVPPAEVVEVVRSAEVVRFVDVDVPPAEVVKDVRSA